LYKKEKTDFLKRSKSIQREKCVLAAGQDEWSRPTAVVFIFFGQHSGARRRCRFGLDLFSLLCLRINPDERERKERVCLIYIKALRRYGADEAAQVQQIYRTYHFVIPQPCMLLLLLLLFSSIIHIPSNPFLIPPSLSHSSDVHPSASHSSFPFCIHILYSFLFGLFFIVW
jgi:hypothetical protein